MGTRGPVPKRTGQKLGHRAKSEAEAVDRSPGADLVSVPDGDKEWHPVALAWFESLKVSGQSRWYEPSDWAAAVLVAESISRDLKPQFVGFAFTEKDQQEPVYESIPLKGASLAAYLKAMSNLLTTEGDRRRAALELQRRVSVDEDEAAAVASLDAYRAKLS